MRRTLAGLLFGLAYACASLTLAGYLLQRNAFDTDHSASNAPVVLADPTLREQVAVDIAAAMAVQSPTAAPNDPNFTDAAIHDRLLLVMQSNQGMALFADVVHDSHSLLIGAEDPPVTISTEQLVQLTRNEGAAAFQPITIEVPTVGVLNIMRAALSWLLPIAAIATLALVVLGLAAHPERSALFRSLGLGLLLLALMAVLLGFLVPKFLIPALSDDAWANLPARLADDMLPKLILLEVLLVGGALALLAGTGAMRRRQRWSTPVSTYRYQEERRWSG